MTFNDFHIHIQSHIHIHLIAHTMQQYIVHTNVYFFNYRRCPSSSCSENYVCVKLYVILAMQTSRASSRILHKNSFDVDHPADWLSPRALWDLSAFPWSVWVYCPTSARHGCSSFRNPAEKEV